MNESTRTLASLRAHPENAIIFGDPEDSEEFEGIKASIRKHGIWEPIAIREDGTILSGHLRYLVAQQLGFTTVPVRVVPPFPSYRDEVVYIVGVNAERRQLTRCELAIAYKRLKELPRADGGAKRKMGRPAADEGKGGASATLNSGASASGKSRDDAAEILGVGTHEARALEKVFCTPGVPDELKRAVNKGTVAPTPAAKAVQTEIKRQGGTIVDPAALKAAATPPVRPTPAAPPAQTHEQRVEAAAMAFEHDFRRLFEAYTIVNGILTSRPLKSVTGPTEHHQYRQMIRDISLRAWREIETVEGGTTLGKQMTLTVVPGGKP